MKLTLKIWRQENASSKGSMQTYPLDGVSPDMSFLEMMDVLNEQLMEQGIDPSKGFIVRKHQGGSLYFFYHIGNSKCFSRPCDTHQCLKFITTL